VATEKSDIELIPERLQILGISLVSEWDVLTFVHRHGTSLGNAAQIARFIGYDSSATAAALRTLDARGLIERSRVSQGIRLYQISTSLDSSRRSCLLKLVNVAQDRAGRLLVIKNLRAVAQVRRDQRSGLGLV
jgi:DNA-binding MarR family transcriptional regulator